MQTKKQVLAVAVAKDVIKTIKLYKSVRSGGRTFVSLIDNYSSVPVKVEKIITKYEDDSKTAAQKLKKYCTVCGLGACLMSVISLENKFNFTKIDTTYRASIETASMIKRLKAVFSIEQMYMIENAFELGKGYFNPLYKWNMSDYVSEIDMIRWGDARQKAIDFGAQFTEDNDRLKAIMKNIIANKGVFIP